jgi:hypothetical protein
MIAWLRAQALPIAGGLLLVALGYGAMTTWRLDRAQKAVAEAVRQSGREQARADQALATMRLQSDGILALAKATNETRAAVAANGEAARAALSDIARRVVSFTATADELATRPAGPPETACARATVTLRTKEGMTYVPIDMR